MRLRWKQARLSRRGVAATSAVVGVIMIMTQPAQAQLFVDAAPTFPDSREPQALIAWLSAVSDMSPSSVVEVTPAEVTGIMSFMSTPDGPSVRRVILRSEVVSAAAYERDRVLSRTSNIQIDCRSRKAMFGRSIAYSARSLIGDGEEVRAASSRWVAPTRDSAEYNAILRICDGRAANPLLGGDRVAAASAPTAVAAPSAKEAVAATIEAASASPRAGGHPEFKASDALAREPMTNLTAVQLSASSSQAKAEQVLAMIQQQSAVPAAATPRVTKVSLSGKIYYRALLVGFATREEASDFCRTVADKGGDCFVRMVSSG
jgi:hypothetical protein